MAAVGSDWNIKLYDRREGKVVHNYCVLHEGLPDSSVLLIWKHFLDCVNCVRWDPHGNMIGTASDDKTVTLLDFKSGKVIYSGNTIDGSIFLFFNYFTNAHLTASGCGLCLFHVSNLKVQESVSEKGCWEVNSDFED